ncbi:MAG TPA: transposase [Candidatus Angelobacter sp.]|jgi:putative transposase
MARPARNSGPEAVRDISRTFFVTSKTAPGKAVLRAEHMALLMIDVLRSYVNEGKFVLHDFVVMPDHIHLILSLDQMMSVEKAMQLVKGGFSYRAKKELGYTGEVWQPGFSEVRILDRKSFLAHRKYIEQNPVKPGLAESPDKFPYDSAYFKNQKRAGAKAQNKKKADGTTKVVP